MEHNIIYTYGGGEVLYYVFNGLAAILGGGTDSMLMQVFKLASVFGGFWAIVSIIVRNNLMVGINWFMWFLIATELLFIPKVPVIIKDPVNQYNRHVDAVPFGLAFVAGFLSQFGQIMTEKMEQNFSLLDDFKYHKTGSVFASRLISSMDKVRITDADFAQSMHNFVNQCIVLTAMIGNRYTLEELRNNKDIWGLVKSKAPKLLRFSYLDPKNKYAPPELLSCKEGAIKLEADLKEQIATVTNRLAKINMPDFIASLAASSGNNRAAINAQAKGLLEGYLTNTFSELKTVSNNAEDILRQQMMINAVIDGSSNKLSRLGASSNYATAKAMLQQKNTYSIMGSLAKGLPMVKTVFEALVYGAFVFIILLSLLPGGHKILFGYFQTIAWLQLWAPLNAILNLIITVTAKSRTLDIIGDTGGMTLANSAGVIQLNEDMCSYAMYLSMLVPFISIAVVRGISSFVHLASHIGSGYQAAAASTAVETTSGNISLGNISQRMRSMEGMQMFQNNMSPNFYSGQHREMLADGAERISHLDGSTVYRSGAGNTSSILPIDFKMLDSLSAQGTESTNQEISATASRNKDLTVHDSVEEREGVDFSERSTIGQNSSDNYDLSKSTTSAKASQDTIDSTNQIKEMWGSNTRQAAQIVFGASANVSAAAQVGGGKNVMGKTADNAASATDGIAGNATFKTGGGKFGAGASVGANLGTQYTLDAQRSQGTADIQGYAKRSGYSESLDSTARAGKDSKFGESQSEDKALSEHSSAAHSNTQSFRDSNSMSDQRTDRNSKGASHTRSEGYSVNKDLNQQFLEYLSSREEHGRKFGMETARKIITRGGNDLDMYLKYFNRDRDASILEKPNSSIRDGKAKIYKAFDNTSVGSIESQGVFEKVRKTAQAKGVTHNVVQNKDLKNEIESQLHNADKKTEERKVENTIGMESKQKKVDEKYQKNLYGAALGKIWSTEKDKS